MVHHHGNIDVRVNALFLTAVLFCLKLLKDGFASCFHFQNIYTFFFLVQKPELQSGWGELMCNFLLCLYGYTVLVPLSKAHTVFESNAGLFVYLSVFHEKINSD